MNTLSLHDVCRFCWSYKEISSIDISKINRCVLINKDENGDTALHIACCEGNLGMVKFLVGMDNTIINEKDMYGDTSLHCSAIMHKIDIIKYLIECGADYTIKNKNGKTFLNSLHSPYKEDVEKFIEDFEELFDTKTPDV